MIDDIHILGLGGVGVLVAHALAGIPDSPRVNLLLHRPRDHHSGLLAITRNGVTEHQTNFTIEEYRDGCWHRGLSYGSVQPQHMESPKRASDESPIRFLIVAVKAHHTIDSIRLVKHRLTKYSTILFLQNGSGALDELDVELFPNPADRPCYMSGIVTHCIHRKDFLSAVHVATGSITLGPSPRIPSAPGAISFQLATDSAKLAAILNRSKLLNVSLQDSQGLLRQQLIKLATNSIYNPLTSLLECSVNDLITLNNSQVQNISDALICEISDIIKALPLSDVITKEDMETVFSSSKLKRIIHEIGLRAGGHTTSMLQDMRNGVKTEIMYLNGYFLRWALKLGIECPVNAMIIRMVLEKENGTTKNI
ncbi:Ketopantoate reductase ApbA/PanE, N-terminal [Penicillium expansum]|uniref:Ketopantoate reductase ApbA/PanE, N-terminal n=1 Tax=Penicillium expansum TaxID=27334 RepID=A0A0A2KCI2_PENEN|nr:Ketopantoate reductase ApbA/PanE, N-terminal [Penicillium expansum]KGO36210.1 Ketopantoate reductase ApbA/PanE, N-terminal [Penicillium expansum]KGO44399.1 Ketopantoate reductase ApbA/PanE, N-terminal [Penicillium expansum]KGO62070.1 Ketopantoate reductase ApbA/PanE, N-terminal [Penicillium expansum]